MGLVGAVIRRHDEADPERWSLRAYECVNEIAAKGESGDSPRA